MYTYMCTYIYMSSPKYVNDVSIYMRAKHMYMYTHIHMHTYRDICISKMYVYKNIYICIYI